MAHLRLAGVTKRFGTQVKKAWSAVIWSAVIWSAGIGRRSVDSGGVEGVEIDVPSGGRLAVFGVSGSGKSTLLRLVAGLERCDSGQIWLGGREVTSEAPERRSVVLVAQQSALLPHLAVGDQLLLGWQDHEWDGDELEEPNSTGVFDVVRRFFGVLFGRRTGTRSRVSGEMTKQSGLETSVREDRVWQVVRSLRLESLLDRFPHQLSGGERQRVALGRALVRNPAAFLFDEPLSAVDAQHRSELRLGLLTRLAALPVTTLYVTHDFDEAVAIADSVAVIDRGRIQQVGTPEQVYRCPANIVVARVFARRGINLLSVQWGPVQSGPGRREPDTSSELGSGQCAGYLRAFLGPECGASSEGDALEVPSPECERFDRFEVEVDSMVASRWGFSDKPMDLWLGVRAEDVQVVDLSAASLVGTGLLVGKVVSVDGFGGSIWLGVQLCVRQAGRGGLARGREGWGGSGEGSDGYASVGGRCESIEAGIWWVHGSEADGLQERRIGDWVGLKFQLERLHFFGATSGRRLGKEFNEGQ